MSAVPQATALPRPHAVLTRRCCGAEQLDEWLAPLLPWPHLGVAPFAPGRPWQAVAELFAADAAAARSLLRDALQQRPFFIHPCDRDAPEFNAMVLGELRAAGYGFIHLKRDDEVERLFALMLGQQHEAWRKDELAALRERLKWGEPAAAVGEKALTRMVQQALACRAWMAPLLADAFTLSHESLCRSGLHALAQVDALFAHLGLGERRARLDDATLLRVLLRGDDHAGGLRQYATPLALGWSLIHAQVHATIPSPAPIAPGIDDQLVLKGRTDENA